MSKTEMIREELRGKLAMDAHAIYTGWKDAKDRKQMLTILCDQNVLLTKNEMLDVLEDLGFKVGQMRPKAKNPVQNHEREKSFLEDFLDDLNEAAENIPTVKKHPKTKTVVVITQEMLDTANAVKAIRDEIETLTAKLNGMLDACAERGWVIE